MEELQREQIALHIKMKWLSIFLISLLFFSSLSLVNALTISNTTITSSGGNSIYNNYSNIEQLEVNSTAIIITKANGESLFTALSSNPVVNLITLTDPYNDVEYGLLGNLLVDATSPIISLSLGETLRIFQYRIGVDGGGSTNYVINLDTLNLQNTAWYKNQENTLYAYTFDTKGKPIDVQDISFSNSPLKKKDFKQEYIGQHTLQIIFQK